MEKLKEFMSRPKNTAILGLIGAIIMLISMFPLDMYSIFYNVHIIGLVVYFSIICMRLYKEQGNIRIANYTLVITYIVSIISNPVITYLEGESSITLIIEILVWIITIIYFSNILLRKTKLLNNKIFAIAIIGNSLYMLMSFIIFNKEILLYEMISLLKYIGFIGIVPYFYNYYNLIKEENKNGK